MNSDLEIRKLGINEKTELIRFLEVQESWKKLMAIIPITLQMGTYNSDVSLNNPPKYRSEHFHIIENASNMTKRYCSEILLHEWGTSGRVRPTLGHLKYLLEKAQLFHAVDYVTVKLLGQEPPIRPKKGPAARVTFSSTELENSETRKIEKILDDINYPSSAIANINKASSINTNINYTTKSIPKIVVSESPDVEEPKLSFKVPLVVQAEKSKSESDLIKFSANSANNESNVNIPILSSLLGKSEDNGVSSISQSSNSSTSSVDQSSNIIPVVVENLSGNNRPNLSSLLSGSSGLADNIMPALSGLNLTESFSNVPAISQLLPDLSTSNRSNSCPSPLPNLSLNTVLPHITYTELQSATDNFNKTPFSQGGKFLGSGSFGKVYYAQNLFNTPVAVKTLILENSEEVQIDDRVTKQFRAEVEILSKYTHENLVALLGYSCDGMTYCLIYEYIAGGSLKERLQRRQLIWTVRLYIALGTARAISYLHTAYSTPLIHRDIKSANILLDVTNKPKLCDFGLIKSSPNQNTNTATTIIGTTAYMAPEAIRGDISVKLDTYSFGVVLLELLTSLPPIDENREGIDLVTHIEDNCKEDIKSLLDTLAGSWIANEINYGQKIYEIAKNCLLRKQERPLMPSVCGTLEELVRRCL